MILNPIINILWGLSMRNMLIGLVLIFSLFLSTSSVEASQSDLKIQINANDFITPIGEPQPYINKDNRAMVPIRFIAKALGFFDDQIIWDEKEKSVTIVRDTKHIVIKVGDPNLSIKEYSYGKLVKDKISKMDTVAEMSKGRIFIPIRFVADAFYVNIEYDSVTNKIFILNSLTNNLARYFRLNIILASIENSKIAFTLDSLFIYPVGSQEFKDYVVSHKITVSNDVKYLIITRYELLNISSSKVSFEKGGKNSPWFLSLSHGDFITPEGSGDIQTLEPNGFDNGTQIYFSKSDTIDQMILYLKDENGTKEFDFVKNP
jgi:hypothetical protein